MIFVTLGSQMFQFNRLLNKIDKMIENGVIKEEVYAQIGVSDYKPQHYQYSTYMDRKQFAENLDKADIIITHGGTGVIINAVKKGKKVIAVPRLAKYGEHVDDHQLQLLHQFDELNIICACYDVDELENCYIKINEMQLVPYISNTNVIIESIEEFLTKL